ncbi:copper resistance CopC family protein [Hyphomonas polymorpha]|nr:copper resistance protein CopC [Hyphomonas polymorpha]
MISTRIIAISLAAVAFTSVPAIAQGHGHGSSHTSHGGMKGVSASVPAKGEIVKGRVEKLVLEFEHPMVPKSVQLMTEGMERIEIDAQLPVKPVERVEIPLSETLEPGGYQVSWRAGADDHEMTGSFTFAVR